MTNTLSGRDLISINDFSLEEMQLVMETAHGAEATYIEDRGRLREMLPDSIMAALFFEASLRTNTSFEAAMYRLGGQVTAYKDAGKTTKASVGETLYDMGRMLDGYVDIAVIRHSGEGSAAALAEGASIPIINGGDGKQEHPTQTLLDLYTMMRYFLLPRLEDLRGKRVALVGDLKHGRTVHSLGMALARLGVTIDLVSPPSLAMPADYLSFFEQQGATVMFTSNFPEALYEADVLYMTRTQKERIEDPDERAALEMSPLVLTRELYETSGAHGIILHPLPRVDEISRNVDALEQALYFKQAENGLYVRIALLLLLLGVTPEF